jgi:prepilin-type N-terminal cleavage/methylation domain-containing protein
MLPGDRKGMTLVEMMVALALFGVVMGVVFSFLHGSRDSYTSMSGQVETQQNVRAVLTLLSREIRTAGCDPAEAGFDRLVIADSGRIHCRMDLDGDGTIEVGEPAEDVDYVFDDANEELLRNSGGGPVAIMRGVSDLTLTYFDAAGNVLGPLPLSADARRQVRTIQISITGETDTGEPVDYVTRVMIRNG